MKEKSGANTSQRDVELLKVILKNRGIPATPEIMDRVLKSYEKKQALGNDAPTTGQENADK